MMLGILLSYVWIGVVFTLFRPRFPYRLGLVICWPFYVWGYLEGWLSPSGRAILRLYVTIRARLLWTQLRSRFRR